MGGIFGVAAQDSCVMDLFFGVDYHSHLGTKRGGMTVSDGQHFNRVIHNIENSPFRTKFEYDVGDMHGHLGIGCISDEDPQPLLIQSHLGSFAITTVGKISNKDGIVEKLYKEGMTHFLEQSGGRINATEALREACAGRGTAVVEFSGRNGRAAYACLKKKADNEENPPHPAAIPI